MIINSTGELNLLLTLGIITPTESNLCCSIFSSKTIPNFWDSLDLDLTLDTINIILIADKDIITTGYLFNRTTQELINPIPLSSIYDSDKSMPYKGNSIMKIRTLHLSHIILPQDSSILDPIKGIPN
jgi:hypothetical protein